MQVTDYSGCAVEISISHSTAGQILLLNVACVSCLCCRSVSATAVTNQTEFYHISNKPESETEKRQALRPHQSVAIGTPITYDDNVKLQYDIQAQQLIHIR
jgi:hypothetical protein